ncbi:hypothetical protein EC968_004879 [Mortierella alpina]|nr:hypothetical protein EC968_004879 [Mortierella alpina]
MAISDESSPVLRKHDAAERPWHEAIISPLPWLDPMESQILRGDRAEQLGQLQQRALEKYGLQLLSANASYHVSVQELSLSCPQARLLCDPTQSYGAIARPPSSLYHGANGTRQWHPFLQNSPKEHSYKSSDLLPQESWPSSMDFSAIARDTPHSHTSPLSLLKQPFLREPRPTWESSNSIDDGSHYSLASNRPSSSRLSLKSGDTLPSSDEVMYGRIAHLSDSEVDHLWRTQKARYFLERNAKSYREERLDRIKECRQHPGRCRTTSGWPVFEAHVDQHLQAIQSPIQAPNSSTQSFPERNNRRTRRKHRRQLSRRGSHTDSHSAAPSDIVPSESQSSTSTTVQPTLSAAEADNIREMVKVLMKEYRALGELWLTMANSETEKWSQNDGRRKTPRSAVKNEHIGSISEVHLEQYSEQGHSALKGWSDEGHSILEKQSEQGHSTLEKQSKKTRFTLEEDTRLKPAALFSETGFRDLKNTVVTDPRLPACYDHLKTSRCENEDANHFAPLLRRESLALPTVDDGSRAKLSESSSPDTQVTTGHEDCTLERNSEQDLIHRDEYLGSEDTVATDEYLPAPQDTPEPSSCIYEDANPFALLHLEEPPLQPSLKDEPGRSLSGPPSPIVMPLPPPPLARTPRKQARRRCSNARASRKKCLLSIDSALATDPTLPPSSSATPSEASQVASISKSATSLDLQSLRESMTIVPPSESTLRCEKLLEAAPPSIFTARTRMQLYRDSDNHDAAFLGYDVCELLQSGPCCMSQWNCERCRFEFPGEGYDHFEMPVLPYDFSERTHHHYVFVIMPVTSEGLVPSDKRIRMPEPWPCLEEETATYTRDRTFLEKYGRRMVDTIYFGMTCQKMADQDAEDLVRTMHKTTAGILGLDLVMGREECLALAREMFRLAGYPVKEAKSSSDAQVAVDVATAE